MAPLSLDVEVKPLLHAPFVGLSYWEDLAWPSLRLLNSISDHKEFPKGMSCERRHYLLLSGVMAIQRTLSDGRWTLSTLFRGGDIVETQRADRLQQGKLVALSRVEVLQINLQGLDASMRADPSLRHVYARAIQNLAARTRDHITDLACKTSIEIIASALFEFKRWPDSKEAPRPDTVVLPLNRQHLAHYLGLTPETLSRVLSQLQADHLIRILAPRHIIMCDMPKLRQVANGRHLQRHSH